MENFYICTRRALTKKLSEATDGEMKAPGAVRFNDIDGVNRPLARKGVEEAQDSRKGD